jgi:hypothetical protein
MARNLFWVGGNTAWDGVAGTKWALTSGGAGGQAVPGAGDDITFDAASGPSTVTINGARTCGHFSGFFFTGSFIGNNSPSITVSSNGAGFDLGSSMNFDANISLNMLGSGALFFRKSHTMNVFNIGPTANSFLISFNNNTDNLTVLTGINIQVNTAAAFTSGFSDCFVNAPYFKVSGNTTTTLVVSNLNLTLTGTGTVLNVTNSIAITSSCTNIKILPTDGSSAIISSNNRNFTTMNVVGPTTSSFSLTLNDNIAFDSISVNGDRGSQLQMKVGQGKVLTANNFYIKGNPQTGDRVSWDTDTGSGTWTLNTSNSSNQSIYVDYVSLSRSIANGATWTARNSNNVANNSGWRFVSTWGGFF